MNSSERDALKKVIETNGGQYSGQLEMGRTNVLVTPVADGEKYLYAKRWKIRCLKPEWVYQSLSKGHAVDPDAFVVEKVDEKPRSSTPETDRTMRFGNGSINSTILNESHIHNINETVNTSTIGSAPVEPPHGDFGDVIDSLDLAQIRKAGPFLDGCKMFLSGFQEMQMDKLRRILNMAGVARFNTISESLSHVIVGQRVEDHWKQLQQLSHKPHIVTPEWLLQSYRMQRAAPEHSHLHPDFKTVVVDVSKENFSKKPVSTVADVDPPEADQETQLVHQYLHLGADTSETRMETQSGFFAGLNFHLISNGDENDDEMAELITAHNGRLVGKDADYVVVDTMGQSPASVGKATLVGRLWIEDCVEQEQLVKIEYFHRPIQNVNSTILDGCVIAQSGIEGRLRNFLTQLCRSLGALPQETFARRTVEAKNIKACTHLICPKPEGRKFEAAQNWGVSAVDPKWLMACAKTCTRLPEKDFPVGLADDASTVCASDVSLGNETTKPEHPVAVVENYSATPEPNIPRTALFNMPTPNTPYGRLLNVKLYLSSFLKLN